MVCWRKVIDWEADLDWKWLCSQSTPGTCWSSPGTDQDGQQKNQNFKKEQFNMCNTEFCTDLDNTGGEDSLKINGKVEGQCI